MSRVSDARMQLDAWEAKKPESYTSQYKDKIDGVMGKLDGMKDFSYDPTRDAAYEQYKNSYTRQAKLANENAQANASAISGGYSSSYGTQAGQSAYQNAMAGLSSATNSLYSQALNQYTQKKSDLQSQLSGYQQAMANVDSGLSGLRDKALTLYQLKQNGLSGLLSALQSQDSLEAAEHQGAVANAQDWRDYKKSRADQAAQEKQNFWDNLMQVGTDVVKAGFTAYDRYKGYDQWKQEHELQEKQVQAQLQQMAIDKALDYKERGASEAFLNQFLSANGLDPSILNDWTTEKTTELPPADYLTAMKGITDLYEGGFRDAAGAVADMYGISRDTLNYTPQYTTGSYSGRRSGSSGGSSGSRSGGTKSSGSSPTYAQLLSMSKEFVTMKASDPRYDYYKRTLTDAGWIKDDTPNLLETNRGLTGQSWKGDPENKWGTGTSNRQSQSTGRTASQSSVPQRAQVAANAIKGQRNHGSDDQTIFNSLKYQGYTDDEIWKAFELAG